MLVLLPLVCSDALLLLIPLPPSPTRGEPALCPLIPPAPFSHKGRRGSLGVLMAGTGDGIQGLAGKIYPCEHLPCALLPQGEKGEFGRQDDQDAGNPDLFLMISSPLPDLFISSLQRRKLRCCG